jgi:hypothetical protein
MAAICEMRNASIREREEDNGSGMPVVRIHTQTMADDWIL